MWGACAGMLEDVEFTPSVDAGVVYLSPSGMGEDVLDVLVVSDPIVGKGPWLVLQHGAVGSQELELVGSDGNRADGQGDLRGT